MAYNRQIARHWDTFIEWPLRELTEGEWLHKLLREHHVGSVLDVATGTGFHAVTLARYGFNVEAWDGSSAMLRVAASNARKERVTLKLKKQAWLSKSYSDDRAFDCVICLGNSFAHLLTNARRKTALTRWCSLLAKGGLLVLDVRNFSALVESNHPHIPFCYHGPGLVGFNMTSDKRIVLYYEFGDGFKFSLSFACLGPLEISNEAIGCGFELICVLGNGERNFSLKEADFFQVVLRKVV